MRQAIFLLAVFVATTGPAWSARSVATPTEDIYGFIVNTDCGTFDGVALALAVLTDSGTAYPTKSGDAPVAWVGQAQE